MRKTRLDHIPDDLVRFFDECCAIGYFVLLSLVQRHTLVFVQVWLCGEFVLISMDVMLMIAHTFQCDLALSQDQDHECKSEDKCALCTSMGLTFSHPPSAKTAKWLGAVQCAKTGHILQCHLLYPSRIGRRISEFRQLFQLERMLTRREIFLTASNLDRPPFNDNTERDS